MPTAMPVRAGINRLFVGNICLLTKTGKRIIFTEESNDRPSAA